MAYIKSEAVAKMRAQIKALCPSKEGWKISVIRENHSAVTVAILEAPIDLLGNEPRGYKSVTTWNIETEFSGKAGEILSAISKILNTDNYNNSDSQTDYFDVGHYVNISIGRWDTHFKFVPRETPPPPSPQKLAAAIELVITDAIERGASSLDQILEYMQTNKFETVVKSYANLLNTL